LAWAGLLTARRMLSRWGKVIVGCAVLAAAAAPSRDPLSIFILALLLVAFYVFNVAVVGAVQKIRRVSRMRRIR
jgi:Sec-independent protein secretion pathway component TatC